MNILFINAYFYPESIAFSSMESDLIETIINTGHKIHVVCPIPTRGISQEIVKSYRRKKRELLHNGSLVVRRFWAPQEGRNKIMRAIRYIWCSVCEYIIARKLKNIDVIFAVSTPPTQGMLAGALKKKLQCRFVYSLQDIFPDSMINAKITNEKSLIMKVGRVIEKYTYSVADAIIVISHSFEDNLIRKGVPRDKLHVIYNWTDTAKVKHVPRNSNRLFDELGIDRSKFIIVYAGNLGTSQNPGIILDAAKLLEQVTTIRFIIFGAGSEFGSVKRRINNENIGNVSIFPLMPIERISEVYSLGDVALITGMPGVGKSGMPSKMLNILAAGTPIIASFDLDSELCEKVTSMEAGWCVQPNSAINLSNAIHNVYSNRLDFYKYTERPLPTTFNSSIGQSGNRYLDVINMLQMREKL